MQENADHINCPNCGHEYLKSYQYCPSCGQKNEDSVMSFKEMFLDLLGAFFSFDTKAIRTVPKLLFQPGGLTHEYINGRRQSYLAPFRLYLFISIVLFLLLPLVVGDRAFFSPSGLERLQQADSLMTTTAGQWTTAIDSAASKDPELDSLLQQIKNKPKVNFTVNKPGEAPQPIINFGSSDSLEARNWSIAVELVRDGMPVYEAADSVFYNQSRVTKLLIAQGLKLWTREGKGLMREFLDKASYSLFLLLPLFALFLKLLYIRRKRFYIEHLIFSIHFYSFFFLLIILYILLYKFVYPFPFWILLLIVAVYLYAAMYKVYHQHWFKTAVKWFTLIFATSLFFVPVFFTLALVVSLLFY